MTDSADDIKAGCIKGLAGYLPATFFFSPLVGEGAKGSGAQKHYFFLLPLAGEGAQRADEG